MKIQIYNIIVSNENKITRTEELFLQLSTTPIRPDYEGNWYYGFTNVNRDDYYLYGIIAQEEDVKLVKYDTDKNIINIDGYPWIETYFAIDTKTRKLYLQKRRYNASNLTHGKLITRLEEILTNELEQEVSLVPTQEGLNSYEFREVFYGNKVLQVKFTDINGRLVSTKALLHNPREEWDEYRALSHNTYDAKIIKSALLEAADGETLSKSPTARTFLEAGASGDTIVYENDGGEIITQRKEGLTILDIDIPEDDLKVFYIKLVENLTRRNI